MAGRLSSAASRIMGSNALLARTTSASLPLRSGMGLPVGEHIIPDKPEFLPFLLSTSSFFFLLDQIKIERWRHHFFFVLILLRNQLPVNEELVWDNGTAFPEPCIDRIAPTVGKVLLVFFSPFSPQISPFLWPNLVFFFFGGFGVVVAVRGVGVAVRGIGFLRVSWALGCLEWQSI